MVRWLGKDRKADLLEARTLADPLSEVTRKERRSLLAISLIQLVIAAGVIPTRIGLLGVELSPIEAGTLILILCGVQLYQLVAFWIYSGADLKSWIMDRDRAFQKAAEEAADKYTDISPDPGQDPEEFAAWLGEKYATLTRDFRLELERYFRILSARMVLERWIPIIVAAVSIALGIARSLSLSAEHADAAEESTTAAATPNPEDTLRERAIILAKQALTLAQGRVYGTKPDPGELTNEVLIRQELSTTKGSLRVLGWDSIRIDDQIHLVVYRYQLDGVDYGFPFEVNVEGEFVRSVVNDPVLADKYGWQSAKQ